MEILKIAVFAVTIIVFVCSAFVIREDVYAERNTPWATFVFCLTFALLACVDWF